MECIFCLKDLKYKNVISYFAYIAFCENCPFRFYDYDNNIFFQTNKYEFSYYGFNRIKIYEPQTVIIKRNYNVAFKYLLDLNKEYWINYFYLRSEDNLNEKIETVITYI